MNLQDLAKKNNIEYIERPNGHIQLKGALLVNYYPRSVDRTAYIAGTKKKVKNVTPEQAIKMCSSAPKCQGVKDKRKGNSRRRRRRMIESGMTTCCWCGDDLNINNSSIEHVIPLGRGGLDNANNRKLACIKCNNERGNEMPELKNSGWHA